MKRLIYSLLMGLALMLFTACGRDDGAEVLHIQAAASLKESMDEIGQAFKEDHHLRDDQLVINFASSGTLRQQIEQGAPANLFISADQKNMDLLAQKGLVSHVRPLVTNELVLITPKGHRPVSLDTIGDQERIVLGNVETVPAGQYAKESLMHLGLWESLQDHLVFAKDVRAVTAYISQGAGDLGFVYKTDALAAGDKVVITATVGSDSHDPIIYPVGIVTNHDSPLTQAFYQYLMTEKAQKIFESHGFTPSLIK